MPNNQIDPSLSSALQQAFNKPQPQQPDPQSGLWQALVNAMKSQPSQPAQAQPSPFDNFANKATGQPFK